MDTPYEAMTRMEPESSLALPHQGVRMDAKHRLQMNDENWYQIWKEDGEGRELPYCEIVNTDKETVAEVFRAVNTFDQAREALKAIEMAYENRGEETSLYVWNERMKQAIYQVRKALAAMEDAGR